MVNEMKCSICGKSIKNSVHYVNVNQPACPHCWENFYDGVRYLPAQTRRKLQKTFEEAMEEIVKLRDTVRILQQKNEDMDVLIAELRNTVNELRKSLAKALCEHFKIQSLYYITPWENLQSILKNGLLCYNLVKHGNINYESFADARIQESRSKIRIGERTANDYVPLFFSRKTPMLYRVQKEYENAGRSINEIIYICIKSEILGEEGVWFSDGNIASLKTKIFCDLDDLRKLDWEKIRASYWYTTTPSSYSTDEARRIKGAEVLVPERVDPCYFEKIVVYDQNMKSFLRTKFPDLQIPIEVDREYYF